MADKVSVIAKRETGLSNAKRGAGTGSLLKKKNKEEIYECPICDAPIQDAIGNKRGEDA